MRYTALQSGASLLALLSAPEVLAKPTATTTSTASATTTEEEPSCTASLITTLCDYADPFRAAAISSVEHCWDYCNNNQPCDFVIFAAGNPYLGTGTCWVYPGETYDESKGTTEGCSNQYLSVYDKPSCPSTPTSSGACEATASPSAVAEICGYPPPKECFYDCKASSGAPHCLSLCAEADSCNYAVYNPLGETNSPYEPGNCWIFADGEYNEEDAETCGSEGPEQYVYKNVCPKPKPSKASSSAQSSATDADDESATAQADRSEAGDNEDDEDAASVPAALSLTTFVALGLAMLF